jgi:hypothetical protein
MVSLLRETGQLALPASAATMGRRVTWWPATDPTLPAAPWESSVDHEPAGGGAVGRGAGRTSAAARASLLRNRDGSAHLRDLLDAVPTGRLCLLTGDAGAVASLLMDDLFAGGPEDEAPVLVDLSRWNPRRHGFNQYVVGRLQASYPDLVRQQEERHLALSAELFVRGVRLLPVCVGFDRMSRRRRSRILAALPAHTPPGWRRLVLCPEPMFRSTQVTLADAAVFHGELL